MCEQFWFESFWMLGCEGDDFFNGLYVPKASFLENVSISRILSLTIENKKLLGTFWHFQPIRVGEHFLSSVVGW